MKILYLELYYDLIIPKCIISESLTKINDNIKDLYSKIKTLDSEKKVLGKEDWKTWFLKKSFRKIIEKVDSENMNLKNEIKIMKTKMDIIFKLINEKLPNIKIEK